MVTVIASGLLLGIIIVALYFFGTFKSPYLGLPFFWLFRFALFLLLMLLMLMLWQGGRKHPAEGYDPAKTEGQSSN